MIQTVLNRLKGRLRQIRWRLTFSYAMVALATVLMVEWWGLVGASLVLSSDLQPLDLFQIVVRIAVEIVLPTALALVIPTAFVGALFGQITAQWLDSRLGSFEIATHSWQTGDFSRRIQDTTGDEITGLAGRLNEMADQLQELIHTRQELAALEERNHLARELHDSAKQAGLAAIMQLGAARARLNSDPQAAGRHLDEADELVHQIQQELTGLIWELHPAGLAGQGLSSAVKLSVESWSRQTGILSNLSIATPLNLAEPVEEVIYRILQEALANTARHSHASRVEVEISIKDVQVCLKVRDDGVGFNPNQSHPNDMGLRNMRDRAVGVGGVLFIESALDQGTTITAILPLYVPVKEEIS